MKTVRKSLFETNSSSVHSLSYDLSYELDDKIELDENLVIELKFVGSADYYQYTSINDKLSLIAMALIESEDDEYHDGFKEVYGYLNSCNDRCFNNALKDFKKLLNDHGVKTVQFKWNKNFGYECDDWFMEEIAEEWSYADMENFLKHAIVIIEDRDDKYRREHENSKK